MLSLQNNVVFLWPFDIFQKCIWPTDTRRLPHRWATATDVDRPTVDATLTDCDHWQLLIRDIHAVKRIFHRVHLFLGNVADRQHACTYNSDQPPSRQTHLDADDQSILLPTVCYQVIMEKQRHYCKQCITFEASDRSRSLSLALTGRSESELSLTQI